MKTRTTRSAAYHQYEWFSPASLPPALAFLQDVSLQELTKIAMKRVLTLTVGISERVIRGFYRAINNSLPRSVNVYPQKSEYCRIGDADELEACFKTSEAKPSRIHAVLNRPTALLRRAAHRPQTPSLNR
ncbi:uncharacterized protein H6S33_001370 [Morchella sextelata]|uniref:uncharacterized protein n=1 Tax=Morchella sextelata TaxID=1174677 RepID=UPI001D0414FA|nr:uncharacterized protein H6S33_001370 [Morchella sextelata]KAH0609142.1 hypothetical protein H6S33_001370 [Morchella sextelata]